MGNQRTTFLKRQREADRNDKAKAKEARLAAARSEVKTTKGPQIAWDESVTETDSSLTAAPAPVTNGNPNSPTSASNNTATSAPAPKATTTPAPKATTKPR